MRSAVSIQNDIFSPIGSMMGTVYVSWRQCWLCFMRAPETQTIPICRLYAMLHQDGRRESPPPVTTRSDTHAGCWWRVMNSWGQAETVGIGSRPHPIEDPVTRLAVLLV